MKAVASYKKTTLGFTSLISFLLFGSRNTLQKLNQTQP
jgi:hypothetical protein